MLELVCLSVFPGAMAFAGTMDLLTMTIPNRISVALIVTFFIVAPLAGLGLQDLAWHVLAFVTVLGVGIALFAKGWVGGGDAKIFASASLWFGFDMLLEFIVCTALFGGLLTLFVIFFRIFPLPAFLFKVHWIDRLHNHETMIPYGIAIAAGALFLYPSIPWLQSPLF